MLSENINNNNSEDINNNVYEENIKNINCYDVLAEYIYNNYSSGNKISGYKINCITLDDNKLELILFNDNDRIQFKETFVDDNFICTMYFELNNKYVNYNNLEVNLSLFNLDNDLLVSGSFEIPKNNVELFLLDFNDV